MKVVQVDSRDKDVFVGIDVHKKSYSVVGLGENILPFKVGSVPAQPRKLIDLLHKRFPGARIHTAYEASFSGFCLHRLLVAEGFDSIVVNPASIEVAANDRVKTDKRDAAKLALQLSKGNLKSIRIPSVSEELARQLTRTREQLVVERGRIANQIKGKLLQFGFWNADDKAVMTLKLLKEIEALDLPGDLAVAIGCLATLYRTTSEQIKVLKKKIIEQANHDKELTALYQSAPGVGIITARTLANELGDMSQFHNEESLFRFVGLTPTEYSSGEKQYRGHISQQGAARLRRSLVEASWIAVRKDPALAEAYARIKQTRGGKRAIVAIARRLVGRLRSCVRDKTLYECGRYQLRKAA